MVVGFEQATKPNLVSRFDGVDERNARRSREFVSRSYVRRRRDCLCYRGPSILFGMRTVNTWCLAILVDVRDIE